MLPGMLAGTQTDIGLIDAHTKCNGSRHDNALVVLENILMRAAICRAKPGMVRQSPVSLGAKKSRRFLYFADRQ